LAESLRERQATDKKALGWITVSSLLAPSEDFVINTRSFLITALAAAVLSGTSHVTTATAAAARNPIGVVQCFVTVPKAMSTKASGTQIVYVNRGPISASHVTFAVGYRNASGHYLRRVTDDGTFAPGVQINHHFSLYNDLTYSGKHVTACTAVKVIFSNGTAWAM